MDAITEAAILNQLRSTNIDPNNSSTITCSNALPVGVSAFVVWSDGTATWAGIDMAPLQTVQTSAVPLPDKAYLIWRETVSNAFVCAFLMDWDVTKDYSVVRGALCDPGQIGPVPKPTADILVPQDSTKVVVSCGQIAGGTAVRYQYWHVTPDSFSLPPEGSRTYSLSTSTGMQTTSSDITTVASSMSVSSSAGWGPVSASLSYALSTSTTTMHSYTVTEETTRYESVTLPNPAQTIVTYFAWQLMDVVEIYLNVNSVTTPSAALVSARAPLVFDGPYTPSAPTPGEARKISQAEYVLQKTYPLVRPLPTGQSRGFQ